MSALSTQEVRIRLEGRLELLELALPRYAHLTGLMRGSWRRNVIEHRALIEDVIKEEAPVGQALEHVTKLAEREGLPADSEPRVLLAALYRQRAELFGKLGGRLMEANGTPPGSLREALDRLYELTESVRLPEPHELVILQGTAARAFPLWALTLIPTLAVLATYGGLAAAGVLVSMICFGLAVLPLGKYTLLADRLVWVPYRGDPVAMKLDGPELSEISLVRQSTGLVLEGRNRVKLPVITSPLRLVALLWLYRAGPLKGVNRPPSGTALILPCEALVRGAEGELIKKFQGTALVHAEGLCVIARGWAPGILARLCPRAPPIAISEEWLFEQLTRLPADGLSAALRVADAPPDCLACTTDQVEPQKTGTPTQLMALKVGTTEVMIPIGAIDFEALRTLFPWTQDKSRQVP
jgi:hypothetical protein